MKKLLLILLLFTQFLSAQFNPVQFFEYGGSNAIEFVSSWKTDNISTGSSANNQVKLPLPSTGVYNMTVDWGDGNSNIITVYNQAEVTHTYSSIGTYTIKIKGICQGWSFNSTGDRLKILSISRWGVLQLTPALVNYFQGCANLTLSSVSDVIDLSLATSLTGIFAQCTSLTTINRINEWNTSSITSLSAAFLGSTFNDNVSNWNVSNVTNLSNTFSCPNFNQNIGAWNVGTVTNFTQTFRNNTAFNQNIGAWNVSNGTVFTNFMQGKTAATFSTTNLDAIYNGWSSRPVQPSIAITFGTAKYTSAASAGRAILTSAPNNWTITDGGL